MAEAAPAEVEELPGLVALGGPFDRQAIPGKIKRTKRVKIGDATVTYHMHTFRGGDLYVLASMTAYDALKAAERYFAEEPKP